MYCYERLRDLREDADLTQKEVGALLHTTQQQDAKYELGVQENPTHHLMTLADYYHVSTDYIVGRADWAEVERSHALQTLRPEETSRLLRWLQARR